MTLFLLTAVPVYFIIIDSMSLSAQIPVAAKMRDILYGVFVFAGSAVIYNIIRMSFITQSFSYSGIFTYFLIHDHLLQFALGLAGSLLVYGTSTTGSESELLSRNLTFFAGFYLLWPVNDVIISYGWYNTYLLLLLPVQRLIVISAAAFLMTYSVNFEGWKKGLIIASTLLLPLLNTCAAMLWRLSMDVFSIILTIVLLISSTALFVMKYKKRITA